MADGIQNGQHGARVQEMDLEQGVVTNTHLGLDLLPIGATVQNQAGAWQRTWTSGRAPARCARQDALHQHLQLAAAGLLTKHAAPG